MGLLQHRVMNIPASRSLILRDGVLLCGVKAALADGGGKDDEQTKHSISAMADSAGRVLT